MKNISNKMLAFRVDASKEIGTGHVMRCLVLADTLKRRKIDSHFICRDYSGNLINHIKKSGYTVSVLSKINELNQSLEKENNNVFSWYERLLGDWRLDAQFTRDIINKKKIEQLVIDHYGIDINWELLVRQSKLKKIIMIDDLANRSHTCEVLIDQNFGRKIEDYKNLVPKDCNILVGTNYGLLRDEFLKWRSSSLKGRTNRSAKKLLISFGGIDLNNLTQKIIYLLEKIQKDINFEQIYIVLGENSPHFNQISKVVKLSSLEINLLSGISNMAEIMSKSDIAIGAGGTSALERACLGLPSIIFSIAENQQYSCKQLAQINASIYLDNIKNIEKELPKALNFITNPVNLEKIKEKNKFLCDGLGAKRVVDEIFVAK